MYIHVHVYTCTEVLSNNIQCTCNVCNELLARAYICIVLYRQYCQLTVIC